MYDASYMGSLFIFELFMISNTVINYYASCFKLKFVFKAAVT